MSEVRVTFVQPDESAETVAVPAGTSVMRAAVTHCVEGIEAVCGGGPACGTCHVYVAEDDLGRLPELDDVEDDVLYAVAAPREHSSRLGCQVDLTPDLDGLVVHVPKTQ